MKQPLLPAIVASAVLAGAWAVNAEAHTLPEQATPPAGAVLGKAPDRVRIRFDAPLEPLFSKLVVKDERGRPVSQGNGRVLAAGDRVLETALPALPPAAYHVWWTAVSRDGHHTEGDYRFSIK